MAKAHYEIVEHDGGWAYRLGDTYSETFATKAAAEAAAHHAAAEQKLPGESKTSSLRTARADDIPSTRQAMTGLTRMWSSPRPGR